MGEATSGQRLLVSNTGGTSWTLGAISLAGAAAVDFVYSGSCATGLVLVPGAGCYLVITFDPAVTGALAATLQIGVAGGSPVNVALSGTGSSPPAVSDGPIPLWALGALGAGLLGPAARRLRGVA